MATRSSAKTPSQKLPLDVLGYIADMLGADRRHAPQCRYYKDTLIQLSLTCKFMVPICHRHLFSNISFLSFRRNLRWRNGRSEFLLSQLTIATHYVKNVVLDASQAKFSTSEYDLLRRICDGSSLASVHISTGDWNKLPEETKSVILSLIQIPTLRHLTLEKINNFPAAALSLCCGPIDIALQDIDRLAQPSVDYSIQNPKITSLESSNCSIDGTLSVLLGPVGQNEAGTVMSIIEFDRLRDASFEISTQLEVIQTCKLLEKATCLEKLRIHGDSYITSFCLYSDKWNSSSA